MAEWRKENSAMNFESAFLDSFVSAPKLSTEKIPESFLGRLFPLETEDSSPLLTLLSCGKIHASSPWSFDIRSLDCFLYLYTEVGCGKLLLDGQVYSLDVDSFLLLDCNQRFRIDIAVEPWNYRIAFASGFSLTYYRRLFPKEHLSIIHASPYSDFFMSMERLSALYPGIRLAQKLVISDLLEHMTANGISFLLNEAEPVKQIPSYIEDIHTLFDREFQNIYTLDNLEKQFGISKYRLCREFGAAYGTSPLQYLNKRRIDVARHLLLTTDHRIHVIGSMVGIDNTNHFITLFKKYTGTTPLEYKQQMTF